MLRQRQGIPQAVYNYMKAETYNYMCSSIKLVLDGQLWYMYIKTTE
jgi:hypothetical protein